MKTKKPPKAKKTFKKLVRIEGLLSKIIEKYPSDELGVKALLDSAKASVAQAKSKANSGTEVKAAPKVKAVVKTKAKATTKGKKVARRVPKKTVSKAKTASAKTPVAEATRVVGVAV